MKKENVFYSMHSSSGDIKKEAVLERSLLLGSILCIAGIALGIYSFYCNLLSLLGIGLFLLANALFLAGIFQFVGVTEIECPECKQAFGVSKLQRECKCKYCKRKFRIKIEKKPCD